MAVSSRSSTLSRPSTRPDQPLVPPQPLRNRHQRGRRLGHRKTRGLFPPRAEQGLRKDLRHRQAFVLRCFWSFCRRQLPDQPPPRVCAGTYCSTQSHLVNFRSSIPIEDIVVYICDIKQYYTQIGGSRPFGAAFLFAGYDKNGKFQLYSTDPSGNYAGWKATAIGSNHIAANSFLKQEYKDDMTLE